MKITYRPAQQNDLHEITCLVKDAVSAMEKYHIYQCDEAYQNGHWQYPDREFCVVHRLCVNPHFQHKGVAKQTMQFIEEKCKAEGITAVRLDAFSHNPSALKLYSHMGYSRVGYAHWRKGRFYLFEKYL